MGSDIHDVHDRHAFAGHPSACIVRASRCFLALRVHSSRSRSADDWRAAFAQRNDDKPGQQLAPLPQKFEGKIGQNAAESTPFWPARVVAPNVLLIMTDDTGFGV